MEDSKIPGVFLPVKDYIVHLEDFDLIKIIGKGSYGEVYYAIHKTTGTKAALKKLIFEELDDVQLEYFIREVLILAYYNNFFLVSFLGFSPTNPYLIITEYVPCGSLFDALHHKKGSPILNGTDKTIIALGIIEGMICLHSNKVIHRDLKSLNILLDEHKLPKICDFGISRAIDEDNQLKMTLRIGTFHWMAPEMLDSDDYSYKVDVFAFAIILWEMLTEKVPYQGQDPLKILINVRNNGMRPVIPQTTNEGFKKLIMRCWDQDPDRRPSFTELYEIYRDEDVYFDDTDVDEVHKFFERFPVDDDILHPNTETDNNNATYNYDNKNKGISEGENKKELNNEIETIEINNDINNDINDDINVQPDGQQKESNKKSMLAIGDDKDSYYSEEESIPNNDDDKVSSDHFTTQQKKKQDSILDDQHLHKASTLKTIDNNSNESLKNKDKDKKKDKKKEKNMKKDEKKKGKIEKEKKKEEKKKRKTDSDQNQSNHLKYRRLTSNTAVKKLKDEYSDIKHNDKQNKQAPNLADKTKKPIHLFDMIYDKEIMEMSKRKMTLNSSLENKSFNFNKNKIIHNHQKLSNNIFSEYIDSIDENEQKLSYFIPLSQFQKSKELIYTSDKNNIFLDSKRFPELSNNSLADTTSFVIDDNVFNNFIKSPASTKRSLKPNSPPASPVLQYLVDSNKEITEEEESNQQDENVEDMLRQSSGRGKLINIFKAELEEINVENAIEVFNDLKNLFNQHRQRNENKIKDDVYIFLLARTFKSKTELIRPFNDINGFEMLPISGNSLITPSFITFFSVCIYFDIERFSFKVFNEIFNVGFFRNTRKFLLLLQTLDKAIQNDAYSYIKEKGKLTEIITMLLNHFFDNKDHYLEFNEFPQFLFSIYSKLLSNNTMLDENFLRNFKDQLIDISISIIKSSTEINSIKAAYSILLSKKIDSISLFESQEVKPFQLPLRSIVNHITSAKSNYPTDLSIWESGQLTFQSVSLFARFKKPPLSSTLVTRLIVDVLWNTKIANEAVKTEDYNIVPQMACLILCRIAQTRRGSEILVEKSQILLETAVREADQSRMRLLDIKERVKNKVEFSVIKEELDKELSQSSTVTDRSLLCYRVLMTLFISHVSVIERISTQSYFWCFLEASIRSSYINSMYKYNTTDLEISKCFISLFSVIKSAFAIIRRIQVNCISPSILNESKLLLTLSSKVLNRKTAERSEETAEIALQIIDLLVRASHENGNDGLDFVSDFVGRLPSLLALGGPVAHKALIASISIFLLQKSKAEEALKAVPQLKSNKSNLHFGEKKDEEGDKELGKSASKMIKEALIKMNLVDDFEKYRKTLIDILDKNEE